MIITMYTYTYRGTPRRIYIEREGDVVTAQRYEDGVLTDDLGVYEIVDGAIVGPGPLAASQRVAIAGLLLPVGIT